MENHKYFEDQFDDETVLFVFRKHPIVMRKGLVLWALGMLVGPVSQLVLIQLGKEVTVNQYFLALGAGFVFAALLFSPWLITWYYSVFVITDQRFLTITQKGLFHRGVADVGLEQIQSVNYEIAGLQQTLLGFGTIKMQTYVGDVVIHDLHHPPKIQKRIAMILRDQGVTGTQHPTTQARSTQDEDTEEAY